MEDKATELKFPVVAHHRVIVNAAERDDAAMARLFDGFDLVEPIAEANASAGGKYISFGLSVRLRDREEMARFDAQLSHVPGLKMVL